MIFEKFKTYAYTRPDAEAYTNRLRKQREVLTAAADYAEVQQIYRESQQDAEAWDTWYQIAYIRNSIDTKDEFYQREIAFFNETNPKLALETTALDDAFLASPFLPDLKKEFGELIFYRKEQKRRLVSEANVANQIEENNLIQEYFQVAGNCTADFHGEKLNFYGLLKKMQDPDRSIRKEALTAWSALYASVAGKLDDIYSRMIEVRCRMAETLGLADYTEMAYLSLERFSYDRRDIALYREMIRQHVVPLAADIYESQRKALGVEKLHYYDEAVTDPKGNIAPRGTTKELVEYARTMYRELSPETGEFFDFMAEHELFDLETAPTKQQGGYCTFIPSLKAPFIFANCNQTTADIEVLTHEAGHAFECYTANRNGVPMDVIFATSEVAEIHSMSMEFFTYPWMELFFGGNREEADRYRKEHLQKALSVVPYMACVDEFQHEVYANKMTNAAERYALWHRLEEKYMPWRDYDGDVFLEKGGFWLQKQHLFMCPFYYIDYSIAQMSAFEFFLKDGENHEAAWKDYYRLCCAGGTMSYRKLLKLANLKDPFNPETLPDLMNRLRPLLLDNM